MQSESVTSNPTGALRSLQSLIALLALAVIGLVLVAPLLQGDTLCTDDGALHIYRTVALDRAIADGVLYPRWFPDLAYGYGFPFFVYREPLGYYALEGLHLLGISVPNAFNLVLAGSVILSGVAMFLLARDIFGLRGGLLAGVIYVTAPYTLIGPLTRGNLPEVIAFALMPLILFFFRRLVVLRKTRTFVASILTYAALFLTHNISSLLFTPLLVVYVMIVGWVKDGDVLRVPYSAPATDYRQRAIRNTRYAIRDMRYAIRNMRYAMGAIALALGLTAFFWLPALAEQDQVQLYLTHSTRGNDYHFNFIGLDELLSAPGSSDPNLINPPLRINFGWIQLALAVIGLLAYRRYSPTSGGGSHAAGHFAPGMGARPAQSQAREQRATIIAAALATLALTFMALSASLPLWDNLPLIRFVQFPWRFVGRAMLPAALLAAAIFSPRNQASHQDTKTQSKLSAACPLQGIVPSWLSGATFGISIFIALLFTAPHSYPRVCPTPHDLDINDVFAYERATGHIGVDPLGAYLPRTVIERPTGSPLEAQYIAGKTIERFSTATLPDGAHILDAQYGPGRADLSVSTPIAFTATYLTFDFPGWNAWIDDRPIETRPSDPTGLITFDVPAGEHRIRVEFGESPQRALADGLSLMALLVTIASVVIHRRSGQLNIAYRISHIADTHYTIRFTFYTILALAIFILVKVFLIDAGLTPLQSTRLMNKTLAGVSHPLDVTFGDQLRLLGYDVSASSTRPGETIRIDFYWKAMRPLDTAYQAEVGIADADGWPWSPKHAERPRDYNNFPPAPQWPIDAYAIDSFEVEVLPGAPPGDYAIVAQVFDRETLAPLRPSGALLPGRFAAPIGSIRVDRATRTFNAGQLRIYGGERVELDDDLTLLGYNIDRVDTVPGESVLLTFFWQAERTPQTDRAFRVELVGPSNEVLTSKNILIGRESYPTSHWNAGEQIITLAVMRVPAATPSGEYHWRGSLLDGSSRPSTTFDMQPSFRVTAPERTFAVPSMQTQVDVDLGDFATLLGFDLASDHLSPGGAIDLTIYWQARAETAESYKVFVHVLDTEGRVVTQADAFPVNGARPTTGWLPREVITDQYTIALPGDLPAGQYQIVVGSYDSETGARLKTSGRSEVIVLTKLEAE